MDYISGMCYGVMQNEIVRQQVEAKYRSLSPLMDERMRRQWAASESRAYGWGGVQAVSGAIHMSPNTIRKGLAELAAREEQSRCGDRYALAQKGGGRKRWSDSDAGLLETLEWLVEPVTRGDPCSPLRWTCKSTTNLAEELDGLDIPSVPAR